MKKALNFLNLLDAEKRLSVTQVVLYGLTIKIMMMPADWTAAVAFFFALVNYAHKRSVSSSTAAKQVSEYSKRIESLEATHQDVVKQSEETKRILSQANIYQAFQPKLKTSS